MEMLNRTGLAHGYSFNLGATLSSTHQTVQQWLDSPQTSLYYSLQMQNTQAKDDAMAALDGDFASLFNLKMKRTCIALTVLSKPNYLYQ